MRTSPTHRQKLLFISPGLLIIVVLFAAGICWAETVQPHSEFLLYGILLLLAFLFILYKRSPRQNAFSYFFLGLLFFLLGLFHAETYLNPPADPSHIYNRIREQQPATLEGILLKYPSVTNTSSGPETRLLMEVKALYQPSGRDPQLQKRTRTSGQVLLTLKGLVPEDLQAGNRFLVKTNLSRASTYSTPGSFNYKKHLANQAILIKGWIQSPNHILRLRTVESSHLASSIITLRFVPERIRGHIAAFLDKTLTQPARGLYKAILIGDRNDVPASVLENFTVAGCIHILAISGMHMGLLALVIIALLTWTLKRSTWLLLHVSAVKLAVSIALLPLLLYALIAGFNIPVVRALLMTIVFILAILFDRPGNLINHILLAGLLILAWKPGAIFTASFQLSFSAVIAIALIYPLLYRFLFQKAPAVSPLSARTDPMAKVSPLSILHKISATFLKWLLAGFALTTAAMLGTFPLLLFHFNRFSLVAPLTNLLVEPLICFWSLIIGLLASLCMPIFPVLAKFLFLTGSYGLITAGKICAFFARWPHASLWLPTPSPGEIMLAYLLLISFVVALHLTGKQRRYSLAIALFFLFSFMAAPAVTTITKPPSGAASVTFLDVGHGSSILLQLQGNKNILIDGGGAESDRFNIGERVIGPFLWHQKLNRLDAVVITHPHADHYNGLPFILSRFRPKELWINAMPGHDQEYRELLDLANQLGIKTRIAKAADTLFQSGSNRLVCLHSGLEHVYQNDDFRQDSSFNLNDVSLVLRLDADNKSFLFTADISARMAEILVKEGIKLKADVLMAPHHGSGSSISQDFIKAVAPAYIAISAGRNNPFNFPAKSFFDLQEKGIEVLSTGRDGTITFTLDNGEITASRYQVN
jgi:competence protein ComEC